MSTHTRTLEFTTETFLTLDGNCILGVNATKSCATLDPKLKSAIQSGQCILVQLDAGNFHDLFIGRGDPQLDLSSTVSMVFRRSDFISDRTIMIGCSKVSSEINRDLVIYMQDPSHQIQINFYLANNTSGSNM